MDHPLFSTRFGGFDLKRVQRRDPGQEVDGGLVAQVHEVPPSLEGIKLGEDYGVIFSPYDLSCALDRHEMLDCQGYVRDDAARLAINIVLYAVNE